MLFRSMGMDDGRHGWFVGMKIHDEETWQKIKSGELSMFSIGGKGVRTPAEVEVYDD